MEALAMSFLKQIAMCRVLAGTVVEASLESRRDQITKLVVQIQRADYEGDRAALRRLCNDLAPFAEDKEFGAKVQYWRGFALWRRALNGLNESVGAHDTEEDLKQAGGEVAPAVSKKPGFFDGRAPAGAQRGSLIAFYRTNPALA